MSILHQLQIRQIPHAVIKNEAAGIVDWFVVCRKSSLRKMIFTPNGLYIHNRIQLYQITMSKEDVLLFYSSMHEGYYEIDYKGLEGTAWSKTGNGFKNYIKRTPIRKNKHL